MLPSIVDEIYKVEKKFIDEIDERTILGNFPKKIIRLPILKEHQRLRRRASI